MCKADKNIDILSEMMYNNAECNILHTIAKANMKKGLNASTLKLIAIITMVIDHISWGFLISIRGRAICSTLSDGLPYL